MSGTTSARWERVKRICDEALEVPLSARTAFLDEACADDSSVRAEVESLLGFETGASAFLERPAGATASPAGDDDLVATPACP